MISGEKLLGSSKIAKLTGRLSIGGNTSRTSRGVIQLGFDGGDVVGNSVSTWVGAADATDSV